MDILLQVFINGSVSYHLNGVDFCPFFPLKMHIECIMNNNQKNPTDGIQHSTEIANK